MLAIHSPKPERLFSFFFFLAIKLVCLETQGSHLDLTHDQDFKDQESALESIKNHLGCESALSAALRRVSLIQEP